MVADEMMTLSAVRFFMIFFSSPSTVSVKIFRSWASSIMITPYFCSSGSANISRNKIPSVMYWKQNITFYYCHSLFDVADESLPWYMCAPNICRWNSLTHRRCLPRFRLARLPHDLPVSGRIHVAAVWCQSVLLCAIRIRIDTETINWNVHSFFRGQWLVWQTTDALKFWIVLFFMVKRVQLYSGFISKIWLFNFNQIKCIHKYIIRKFI